MNGRKNVSMIGESTRIRFAKLHMMIIYHKKKKTAQGHLRVSVIKIVICFPNALVFPVVCTMTLINN